jgi:hypothetical protein
MVEIFGWQHLLYVALALGFGFFGYMMIYKRLKTEEGLYKLVHILSLILLVLIIFNRITVVYLLEDGNWLRFLPYSYCGISSLAIAIGGLIFKKDHPWFHATIFVGFVGATLTLVYPDFLVQDDSFFFLPTITGLLHHTMMLFLIIVMIGTQYVKPTLKKYYLLPIGIMGYLTIGIFLIAKLGYPDAMYIFEPALPGSIFDFIGFGYFLFPTQALYLWLWDRYKDRLHLIYINNS